MFTYTKRILQDNTRMVNADIHIIDRGRMKIDSNFLVEADIVATASNPNPDLNFTEIPIYNVLIDHPESTILIDTGSHHKAGEGHWPDSLFTAYPQDDASNHRLDDCLNECGYSIEDIDSVVQTHLHMDHAGGLEFFDNDDTPIYVHKEELKYAYYSAKTHEGSSGYVLEDFDHNLNWRIIHTNREKHFEDIEFLHLPGHTPGLIGAFLEHDTVGNIILVSDHIEIEKSYLYEIPPGPSLVWDRQKWLESLWLVKDLDRRHDAQVVFGHDMNQFKKIKERW